MTDATLSEPVVEHAALTVEATTTPGSAPGWLQTNRRSLILLSLGVVVCYLALTGVKEAVAAVLATFSTLAGSTWGSHDALKVPGRDNG